MNLRRAAACLLLYGMLPASGSPPDGATGYSAMPAHKALAVAVNDPSVRGIASSEPSDQSASTAALMRCRARSRPPDVCEIRRLDDALVTTAKQIRAYVPPSAHPLSLWRFDTGASTVYLAGSIHVMKASLLPLPKQFDAAFRHANKLVVEVNTNNLSSKVLRDVFGRYALLPTGQTLASVLDPATFTTLTAHLQSQAIALSSVASLKPAVLATQLAVARLNALGYLQEFGLEQHFIGAVGDRPILELETLEEQLAVLTSPPMPVQDEILSDTLDQMATIDSLISAMIAAWLSGNDLEFRRLFDLQSGDSPQIQAFMRRLLEDRNVRMAANVTTYLTTPGTTFVLVGAAHLIGPKGIVALLRARGLRGRRINSNDMI